MSPGGKHYEKKQIADHPVWIGHAGDGRAFRGLFAQGIRAVVQVAAEEPPIPVPRDMILYRFPRLCAGNDPEMLALAIGAVVVLFSGKFRRWSAAGPG